MPFPIPPKGGPANTPSGGGATLHERGISLQSEARVECAKGVTHAEALRKEGEAGVLGTRLSVTRLLAGQRASGHGRARAEEGMGRDLPLAFGQSRRGDGDAGGGKARGRA